jgi:hypothetical protein
MRSDFDTILSHKRFCFTIDKILICWSHFLMFELDFTCSKDSLEISILRSVSVLYSRYFSEYNDQATGQKSAIELPFVSSCRPVYGPSEPPIWYVSVTFSPWLMRLECEADHSPPFRIEIWNMWSYTFIPPWVLMSWSLIKHRDNFSPTLLRPDDEPRIYVWIYYWTNLYTGVSNTFSLP